MAAQHRAAGHAKIRSSRPVLNVWVSSDRDRFHLTVACSHYDAQARKPTQQLASANARRFNAALPGPEDIVRLAVTGPESQHPQPTHHDLSRGVLGTDQHRNGGIAVVEGPWLG